MKIISKQLNLKTNVMLEKEDYELKIKKTEEILSNLKEEYTQLIRSKMSEAIIMTPENSNGDSDKDVDFKEIKKADDSNKARREHLKKLYKMDDFSEISDDEMLENFKRIEAGEDKEKVMNESVQKIIDRRDLRSSNNIMETFEIFEFNDGLDRVAKSKNGLFFQPIPIGKR